MRIIRARRRARADHRAAPGIRRLGVRGLNFTAVDQNEQITLARASGRQCWAAVDDGQPVGTLTISLSPEQTLATLTPHAVHQDRAWLNQMAAEQGATAIGVDTATHLTGLYTRWSFTAVDYIQWPGKTYRSTVMLRSLPNSDAREQLLSAQPAAIGRSVRPTSTHDHRA